MNNGRGPLVGGVCQPGGYGGRPFAPSRPATSPFGEACGLERLWVSLPGRGRNGQFFEAWPDIGRCLEPSTAKYKATANLWDLQQAPYCTYQCLNPFNCAAAAKDFSRHCTVGTTSCYLLSLEHDAAAMLHTILPTSTWSRLCTGGARSQVPCLGGDAMEVARCQGHMQASLGQTLQHQQHVRRAGCDPAYYGTRIGSCVLAMIEGSVLVFI